MRCPCRYPGCAEILARPGYCPRHLLSRHKHLAEQAKRYDSGKRANDPVLALNAKIRSSKRWRNVRKLKLSASPLCEDPFHWHEHFRETVPAAEVHHIQGLSARPDLAFDYSNLMSVCTSCHAKLELAERKANR